MLSRSTIPLCFLLGCGDHRHLHILTVSIPTRRVSELRSRAREIEMQLSFAYEANPGRTIFAPGTLASLGVALTRLGFNRALIICTPPQRDLAARINAMLGDRSAGIIDGALMQERKSTRLKSSH